MREGKQGEEGCLSIPGFARRSLRGKRYGSRPNAKGETFEQTGESASPRLSARDRSFLGRLYITTFPRSNAI
jgi:hypothetical protein